jgi:hypothetical protein
MTFEQILARANEVNPNAKFHFWVEYSDGKRGYAKSVETYGLAVAVNARYENAGMSPICYDRDGIDVGFSV